MKRFFLLSTVVLTGFIAGCSKPVSEQSTPQDPAAVAAAEASASEAAHLAALTQQYSQCVQSVLDADAALNYKSQPEVQASQMRSIDTSLCPGDFRQAYEAHIYAWENQGKINVAQRELNSDDNINTTLAASIFAGITGSDATPIEDHIAAENELKRLRAISSQQISDTYEQVRIVSLKYGATLPKQ